MEAIAPENDLRQLLIKVVRDTLFVRDGDDSFAGTRIGQALALLKRHVGQHPETLDQLFNDDVLNLRHLVEERERFLQYRLKDTDKLLTEFSSQIEQDPLRERELRHRLLEELERNLRVIALLEIDHMWSKNLGDDD